MQVAFYFAGEITQVIDAIPWVRCASGNVLFSALRLSPLHFCANIFIPLFADKQHTVHCLMVACHSTFCLACPATMDGRMMYCAVWVPCSLSSTTFCKAQGGDSPPWPFTEGFVVQQKLSKFATVTLLEGSFRPHLYKLT